MKQKDLEHSQPVTGGGAIFWREQLGYMRHSQLARRLLAAILLVSTVGALMATLTELAFDYHHDVDQVHVALDDLQKTTSHTLAYNLWVVNPEALRRQLADLLRLPSIRYVEVVENDGTRYQAGHAVVPVRDRVERTFKLEYQHPLSGRTLLLGTMRIEASTADIKSRLFERFLLILCTQGLKTFLVSFFILGFFQWLVTRHLRRITRQARRINYLSLREPLTLDRIPEDDELNELVDAFNQMRRNLLRDIELWEKNEKSLATENALNQLTLNMMPDAVIRTDNRSLVTWLNPLAQQIVGDVRRQGVGMLLGELLSSAPGFVSASAERLFVDMQNSHDPLHRQLVFVRPDGRVLRGSVSAMMMRDAERQPQGLVLIVRALEKV